MYSGIKWQVYLLLLKVKLHAYTLATGISCCIIGQGFGMASATINTYMIGLNLLNWKILI